MDGRVCLVFCCFQGMDSFSFYFLLLLVSMCLLLVIIVVLFLESKPYLRTGMPVSVREGLHLEPARGHSTMTMQLYIITILLTCIALPVNSWRR